MSILDTNFKTLFSVSSFKDMEFLIAVSPDEHMGDVDDLTYNRDERIPLHTFTFTDAEKLTSEIYEIENYKVIEHTKRKSLVSAINFIAEEAKSSNKKYVIAYIQMKESKKGTKYVNEVKTLNN